MNTLTVINAKYLGGHVMLCTFSSGEVKKIDMSPLLSFPAYSELRDEAKFQQFGLDDTIFWSNGADIAPEWLYDNGIAAN